MKYLVSLVAFLFGLLGQAQAAGTYDGLTSGIDMEEVTAAIIAVAVVLMGPDVARYAVRKIRSMLGR